MRSPDYDAPIVGWRVWRVCKEPDGLGLRSPLVDTRWRAGAEVVAACAPPLAAPPPGAETHAAPRVRCSCGVYAAADAATAARYLVGRDDPGTVHRVLGQVALWGRVVEAARGWRGSHAYPVRIWVPTRRADGRSPGAASIVAALAAYGVEVDLLDRRAVPASSRAGAPRTSRVPPRAA